MCVLFLLMLVLVIIPSIDGILIVRAVVVNCSNMEAVKATRITLTH